MRDLCDKLSIDNELFRMMWTCLEYTLVNHIELMQERHLDQLIMCAIYVIAKVKFIKQPNLLTILQCLLLRSLAGSNTCKVDCKSTLVRLIVNQHFYG